MSYCRWSCDNYKSDVYVYESNRGFMTHVASNRHVGDAPDVPPLSDLVEGRVTPADFAASLNARDAYLEKCPRVKIGLPEDGKTFCDVQIEDCIATLRRLAAMGYHVPSHAFEGLEEDAASTEAA